MYSWKAWLCFSPWLGGGTFRLFPGPNFSTVGGGTFRFAPGQHFPMSGPCFQLMWYEPYVWDKYINKYVYLNFHSQLGIARLSDKNFGVLILKKIKHSLKFQCALGFIFGAIYYYIFPYIPLCSFHTNFLVSYKGHSCLLRAISKHVMSPKEVTAWLVMVYDFSCLFCEKLYTRYAYHSYWHSKFSRDYYNWHKFSQIFNISKHQIQIIGVCNSFPVINFPQPLICCELVCGQHKCIALQCFSQCFIYILASSEVNFIVLSNITTTVLIHQLWKNA